MLFYGPDSDSLTSRQVYNPGKRNAVLSIPTLESRHRREAQIQDHCRLGELRDHPGDLADLYLRYAPCSEALSIEALGPAVLPGHGRKRSAHDLLSLRVQRRPQTRHAYSPLHKLPDALAGRPQILPAARYRLRPLRPSLHRTAHRSVRAVWGRVETLPQSAPSAFSCQRSAFDLLKAES